ncbi:metal ABC transporter solute-binding protein, Zn/Mn family [Shouchella shacheensis]|uniref:metal ABC transporter solute-binding protein, Zn/Mn family n=1 Tax=Shouchella shacheensis TaxID=1649580 RepID=UPI00073FAD24|nr:zinc ABC transporter substrate-binding protein [Shouchella shacheensis]
MKKSIATASVAVLFLNACSNAGTDSSNEAEEEQGSEEKLTIMTSIFPLEDWTKKIGGDYVDVANVVPVGADAHTYEPTPNEMMAVTDADAFIYNGAGVEAFADSIVNAVENEGVEILEASDGVELIEDSHDHDHSHDRDDHEHDDHSHEHDEEHDDHSHEDDHEHDDHSHEDDHEHGETGAGSVDIDGLSDHYHSGDDVQLSASEEEESGHDDWHWYTLAPDEDPEDEEAWEVVPDNGTDTYEGTAEEEGQQIKAKLFGDDHEVVAQSEPVTIAIDDHEDDHDHGHEHGDYDPHVWLDPVLSVGMAEQIKDLLVDMMPEQEEYFEENFETLKAEFGELDQEFQELAEQATIDTFIVSHAGYGYWEERYGINQMGIAGISPTNEPSQSQLVETIEQAEELGLEHVLFEPNITPAVAETVQDHLGAEALHIHPLEALTEEDVEAGADYFSLMKDNIETLRTVLDAD